MGKTKQDSYEIWDQKFWQKSESPYCIYEVDRKKGIATITLNKPEKLNASTPGDLNELRDRTIEAEEDLDVKVIIYKGAGECFSSGVDLEWIQHAFNKENDERRLSQRYKHLRTDNLYGLRGFHQVVLYCLKATIAQVHGYCYGTAFQLVCACDIVIASEDALFANPAHKYIGASPEDMVLLFSMMGTRRTKEMMLTGRAIDAQEAMASGLINRVVKRDQLEGEVNRTAAMVTSQPYDAIVTGKACFETALDIVGVGTGEIAGAAGQTWQSNIQYRPGEFNLLKSLTKKGVKGAIKEREKYFSGAPLAKK